MSPRNAVETEVDGFHRSDHAQILACLTDDVAWDLPGFRYLRARAAFDGEIENESFVGSPALTVGGAGDSYAKMSATGSRNPGITSPPSSTSPSWQVTGSWPRA